MRLGNLAGENQANPRTLRFGREKWHEQILRPGDLRDEESVRAIFHDQTEGFGDWPGSLPPNCRGAWRHADIGKPTRPPRMRGPVGLAKTDVLLSVWWKLE